MIDLARLAKLAETARGTGYGPVELPPATVTALVRLGQALERIADGNWNHGNTRPELTVAAYAAEALAPFRDDA